MEWLKNFEDFSEHIFSNKDRASLKKKYVVTKNYPQNQSSSTVRISKKNIAIGLPSLNYWTKGKLNLIGKEDLGIFKQQQWEM